MKEISNKYYYINNYSDDVKLFLNGVLSPKQSTTKDTFKIYTGKQYFEFVKDNDFNCYFEVRTNLSKKDISIVKIGVEYTNNREKAAFILSDILQKIDMHKKRNFYAVSLEDNLSLYYSQRMYKTVAYYERSLRTLVLSFFVPIYSKEWHKIVLKNSEEESDQTGKKKPVENINKIEKGLEKLTLTDLEEAIFGKRFKVDSDNYKELFRLNDIPKLTGNEIKNLILDNKPFSFWEKYLSEYVSIKNIEIRMANVKNQRNKVAHHKYFSKDSYLSLKRDLNYIIPKIEKANNEILEANNIRALRDIANELSSTISKQYADAFKSIQETAKLISDSLPKIPKFEIPPIIFPNISDIIDPSVFDAFRSIQDSIRPYNNYLQEPEDDNDEDEKS
ncbi:hypothetical protein [Marinilactibacillus psychrotolerans]|uniref:hypothetical protein n=1 Tax=Marinilactibacillus psychrotolerans TaxID=191770 RepID=UPI003886554D